MTHNVISQMVDRNDAIHHLGAVVDVDGRGLFAAISPYLAGGRFFALVPEGTTCSRMKQLNVGGLVSLPTQKEKSQGLALVPNLSWYFAKTINRIGNLLPRMTAFIREPYLENGDKSELVTNLVSINETLYKVVDLKQTAINQLESDIRRYQVSWSFFMLVSEVAQDEKDIKAILSRAVCVAVNAYDGESYLYWLAEPLCSASKLTT